MSDEEKVELNRYYVNKKIKSHILSDDKMKKAGFQWIDSLGCWCYGRGIPSVEISFNVDIYPDHLDEPNIMVLDEDWGQNYDYQYILSRDPEFKVALMVQDFVEKQMDKLQKAGVLSGHVKGEYI